jgi:hypothetical protein
LASGYEDSFVRVWDIKSDAAMHHPENLKPNKPLGKFLFFLEM